MTEICALIKFEAEADRYCNGYYLTVDEDYMTHFNEGDDLVVVYHNVSNTVMGLYDVIDTKYPELSYS